MGLEPELKTLRTQFVEACENGDKELFAKCITNPRLREIIDRSRTYHIKHGEIEKWLLRILIENRRWNFTKQFLTKFPEVDVNQGVDRQWLDRDKEDPYEKRESPLFTAIKKASSEPDNTEAMEVIDMLLHHPKIDINRGYFNDEKEEAWRVSPLVKAIQAKNLNVVAKILDMPSLEMDCGENPLYFACEVGDYAIVERILHHPSLSDVNKRVFEGTEYVEPENDEEIEAQFDRTDAGPSPLSVACGKGFTDVVKLLLSDPRVNPVFNAINENPLACALYNKHNEIVNLLFAQPKVDVNLYVTAEGHDIEPLKDHERLMPIQIVIANNDWENFDRITSAPDFIPEDEEFFPAALGLCYLYKRVEMFKKMLGIPGQTFTEQLYPEEGIFPIVCQADMTIPENLEMAKMFLEFPGFLSNESSFETKPLSVAAHYRNREITKILLLHGTDESNIAPEDEEFIMEVKNELACATKVAN